MKYNYGIALLKIVASFGVVYLHFGKQVEWAVAAAPLFMLVALFLSGKTMNADLGSRVKRLYVPFAAWGLIYYLTASIMERNFDMIVLLQQLTIGVPVCPPLYFMMILVVATVIIWGLKRLGTIYLTFKTQYIVI